MLLRFLLQDAHLGAVHRRRFLAEDMFSGSERGQGGGEMKMIRQTDHDRIDLRLA